MVDPMPRPLFLPRILAVILCAVPLAACGAPDEKAHPALWAVRDADTTLYLFGTVHQLPPNIDWDEGAVGTAIRNADILFLELSPEETSSVPAAFEALARRSPAPDLSVRFGPKMASQLEAIADVDDIAVDQIATLDDWAIAVLVGRAQSERAGLSPAYGVEPVLTARFAAAGKPVRGLESAKAQLKLFDTLPAAAQRAMLKRAVDGWDKGPQEIATMLSAWKGGDTAALAAKMNGDLEQVDGLADALITARNRRWADWASRRMDSPGTVLIAVGAGHLTGDASLVALLGERGLTVTRLQ